MDLEKRVDEHDVRIRKLEESDIKQQMQLQEIKTSQIEIKNMLLERDKKDTEREKRDIENQKSNNQMMQKLISDLTESITDTIKSNNSDNTYSKKQFWIFLGSGLALIGSVIILVGKYFGL